MSIPVLFNSSPVANPSNLFGADLTGWWVAESSEYYVSASTQFLDQYHTGTTSYRLNKISETARPTLTANGANGKDYFLFDGGDSMDNGTEFTDPAVGDTFSMWVVLHPSTSDTTESYINWTKNGLATGAEILYVATNDTIRGRVRNSANAWVSADFTATKTTLNGNGASLWILNYNNGVSTLYEGSTQRATASSGSGVYTGGGAWNGMYMAEEGNASTKATNGTRIYELGVCRGRLFSTADLLGMVKYANKRYGLTLS